MTLAASKEKLLIKFLSYKRLAVFCQTQVKRLFNSLKTAVVSSPTSRDRRTTRASPAKDTRVTRGPTSCFSPASENHDAHPNKEEKLS